MRYLLCTLLAATSAFAQTAMTWDEVKERFEASNPTLRAGRIGIDESRAQEITAHLRPNPEINSYVDQVNPFTGNPYRPLGFALPYGGVSYLHERGHKRELRTESAREGTAIAESQLSDQERNLLFNLRTAFVNALQATAVLGVAKENLDYYDRVLAVSRTRFQAGDIAKVDLDRLELQRVQFETDVQTAVTSVRTAKIQLLALMSDNTPVEQFGIAGAFDFTEPLVTLPELHDIALAARPDLRAAQQTITQAKTNYKLAVANGTADPTFSMDFARNPPIPVYLGVGVNIPLRIFDRNQGEKARTALDITRSERLADASQLQVFSDVDSAWATLNSNLALLRPYKAKYLAQAASVRDTISFAYQRGGASLLDFLNAQNDYRSVRLNYLNMVGAWLSSAAQLNLAVGREVIK
jgi:cobalt-zinc-cadmium efflux system outer membrane protein